MARIARFVVPDLPHHVTQRGNRRMQTFFGDEDYALYLDLLSERCRQAGVAVWSYCLMPNHVHLILTPSTPEGLGRALGETHRRYASVVNARLRVTGHLFQSRYGSVAMDEAHLIVATAPILERCSGDFAALIAGEPAPALLAALRGSETIGRPLGSPAFLDRVAALTGRDPRPRKRGPKRSGPIDNWGLSNGVDPEVETRIKG